MLQNTEGKISTATRDAIGFQSLLLAALQDCSGRWKQRESVVLREDGMVIPVVEEEVEGC